MRSRTKGQADGHPHPLLSVRTSVGHWLKRAAEIESDGGSSITIRNMVAAKCNLDRLSSESFSHFAVGMLRLLHPSSDY